ncbi:type-F conjugative transfer system protein TraW [Thauera butanivorans]|uniref:type-F conjugative transfer system protein TraW n=1 Tax=Thauera butanivorans TaxID=86174 RepID=UPI0008384457|nr:type-F conjugative transfer system protein TraW [Thauera butanivorans]
MLLASLGTAIMAQAMAIDLGTHGPVYPIEEPDLLEALAAQVQQKIDSGEWARIQREAQTRVIQNAQAPKPVAGLGVSRQARHWTFDPSIVLSEAITDREGRILFPAGTRVNPLDVVDLAEPLLFFDARDDAQVALAAAVIEQRAGAVTPVLVGGAWAPLAESWQRRVYFDQSGILSQRFGLSSVPALVTQDGALLRIDELPVTGEGN